MSKTSVFQVKAEYPIRALADERGWRALTLAADRFEVSIDHANPVSKPCFTATVAGLEDLRDLSMQVIEYFTCGPDLVTPLGKSEALRPDSAARFAGCALKAPINAVAVDDFAAAALSQSTRRNGAALPWRPFGIDRTLPRNQAIPPSATYRVRELPCSGHTRSDLAARVAGEAARYRVVGSSMWRTASEPMWVADLDRPLVFAASDHAIPGLSGDASMLTARTAPRHALFPGDARAEAISFASRIHKHDLSIVGDIETISPPQLRTDAQALNAALFLRTFIPGTRLIAAACPPEFARVWLKARELAWALPDARHLAWFREPQSEQRLHLTECMVDLREAVLAAGRSGLIDGARCADALASLLRFLEVLKAVPGYAGHRAPTLSAADDDALGTLAS